MQNTPWPAFGHQTQTQLLQKEIDTDHLAHAYLFVGPDKIGKFTVAKAFARNLQCPQGGGDNCLTCQQVQNEQHQDTFFWRDNGASIKVSEVRTMLTHLTRSFSSPHRIWLIQNASRLTLGAANSLLKTLEEPIPGVIFIFTTDHLTDLPATVASRMRIIHFQNIPFSTLQADLEKHLPDSPPTQIEQAINYSLGKPGWALRLLSNPHEFEAEKIRYQEIRTILADLPLYQRFRLAEKLAQTISDSGTAEITHFFENTLNLLRTHLHTSLRDGSDTTLTTHRIQSLYRAHSLLEKNINRRLVLEHLLLNF